jgi:hypothetical protein
MGISSRSALAARQRSLIAAGQPPGGASTAGAALKALVARSSALQGASAHMAQAARTVAAKRLAGALRY